jgi:hypothetical protein
MKHIHTFESFLNEAYNTPVSGTKAGWTTSLDRKKYELKQDVKGAKIGKYTNVVLPKGTIITNLPGGVFANHEDLKKNYCTGYDAERWNSSFGVMITQTPETLEEIEKNGKVLESFLNENNKKIIDYSDSKNKIIVGLKTNLLSDMLDRYESQEDGNNIHFFDDSGKHFGTLFDKGTSYQMLLHDGSLDDKGWRK